MSKETYWFCRNPKCGHYGLFIAASEEVVACPKCYQPMRRQDTGWMNDTGSDFFPTKEEGE